MNSSLAGLHLRDRPGQVQGAAPTLSGFASAPRNQFPGWGPGDIIRIDYVTANDSLQFQTEGSETMQILEIHILNSHKIWFKSVRKTFVRSVWFSYTSGLQSGLQTCGKLGKAINCDSGKQTLECLFQIKQRKKSIFLIFLMCGFLVAHACTFLLNVYMYRSVSADLFLIRCIVLGQDLMPLGYSAIESVIPSEAQATHTALLKQSTLADLPFF